MTSVRIPFTSSRIASATVLLAVATLAIALLPSAVNPPLRPVLDALLVAALAGLALSAYLAAQRDTGTRRAVFHGIAAGAAFCALGQGVAMTMALAIGGRTSFPSAGDLLFFVAHAAFMAGILAALGRVRPLRFVTAVDSLLLAAAAAIVIVQLDYFPQDDAHISGYTRTFVVLWQMVGAVTLMLLAMLLSWRGERLGARTATALALGTVAVSTGTATYIRMEISGDGVSVGPAIALLAIAALSYVLALDRPRVADAGLTAERPRVASDAASIRAVSIVVAILIASGSAAALGFRSEPDGGLGLAVAAFGVLLAVRTAYALWQQRRTTLALENSVVAEREMSTTLEHRVAERTRELAEAQRALQRMWTLAQQIALELNRDRMLDRFLEAIQDVTRADGAAVALQTEERLLVAGTAGIAMPLKGVALKSDSALGRVLRSGEPWWSENAHYDSLGEVAVQEAELAPEIRGMATVPLERRGERIGSVAIVSRRGRRFSDQEIAHVEAMTDLLSLALANASLLESMRQTEWRFRTLFRAAPDAVLTVLESGRIKEANDAVRDITGLEPVQVVGRAIDEFIAPEDCERVRFELAETLAGAPARLEARFVSANGSRMVSLAARRLPQADPPTVLLVGRDMTSEREMRARLAETERLAAVGELVAGVAHEVNNPLSTISAFAQLLLKDDALGAEQRESVDVIHSETVRASQVMRDLLTFARRSEGVRQAVDLNELLQRTLRLRSYEMEKEHISPRLELADSLPAVHGDPGQIQQVAVNLITNAIQAMRSRGGWLRVATGVSDGEVMMEVQDSGPGIPAEIRARIFEPFFTTKKDGTGLGLSVSYGIVTAHGGRISVVHSSPEGTTFRVMLRCADEAAVPAGDLDGMVLPESSPLRGLRILFVDDEPSLRSGMLAFGRLRRIKIVTAEDGASALEAARIGDFDVVVCDLRMPGMDGASLYEALREEMPELAARTLFITGDVVSPGSRAFLDATHQPVLTKPFEFEQLEAAIGSLIRKVSAALDA